MGIPDPVNIPLANGAAPARGTNTAKWTRRLITMPAHNPEMNLDGYLSRIAYHGSRRPDLDTLTAVHRAHLTAISYENLDIHLDRVLSLDITHIYDKIVRRGRGGWCYEMNSLLAWALRELGFDVTMLAAAVAPVTDEDRQHLDHMAVRVMLDEPWLLDAGFGNAFLEPLPLREGQYQQAYHTFQLWRNGDYWGFTNHVHGGPGFEFLLQPRTIEEYGPRCTFLQSSPESPFVRRTVCHRLREDYSIVSLRGLVLTTVNADGKTQEAIETLEGYTEALTKLFLLRLSDEEIVQLWEKVWPAHLAWVQSGA
jgi:N-hydroxyarylamine O-acetyltransferase